jgi:CRP-like cAMP-binding protein
MNPNVAVFLVHFSNVLMLLSYSVRNILWLRWFAVSAAITVIPYYFYRQEILWPPILWAAVFLCINLFQIARIYAERRPVRFSPDEQTLYDMGFHSLAPRDFISLVLAGEWRDAQPGEQPLTEGQPVSSVCIATAGTVQISRLGKALTTVKPGHVLGTALALTGNASPVSASFTAAGRYIRWPLANLRTFLDAKPELREAIHALVSRDLADKLETTASMIP